MISQHPVRWLFLDLNSYFASVEQQENPALRGKPVGVVPVMVNTTCCLAASYEAKAFGIQTGTLVAEAKLRCPQMTFVEARHDLYVKYHHAIVEAVESCLHVDAILSIDEMIGRLYGKEQEREEAIKLAVRVKAAIAQRVGSYLKSSIGIAPNRFLAKVAGEMQKPNGLTVIEDHQLPQILFPLQLRDLPGIGENMENRLHRNGITTVKQLCSLDDKTMRTLWGGVGGDRYAAWLRGEEVDLPPTKHSCIGHSHVLEPDLRNKEGAYRVAKRLLAKAALRLRRMGYWSGGMAVNVRLKKSKHWEQKVKLADTQDTPTFLQALAEVWGELPNDQPTWVGITLAPLVPPSRHNFPLFDNQKREKLSHTMDAINEKYGKNTAIYASLFDVMDKAPTRIPFTRVPDLAEF